MTDISVSFIVPDGVDSFDYRDMAEILATELGFPAIIGAGTAFSDPLVVDLSWSVNLDPDKIAEVIAALRSKFNVSHVGVYEEDDDGRLEN